MTTFLCFPRRLQFYRIWCSLFLMCRAASLYLMLTLWKDRNEEVFNVVEWSDQDGKYSFFFSTLVD